MKNIFFTIVPLSAILLLSCSRDSDCAGVCTPIYPDVVFRIMNSSGQNLVSGPSKAYTSDKISIKYLASGVLTNEAFTGFNGDSTLASTSLVFNTAALSNQYYLYINNVKTDSFQVVYQSNAPSSDCCPGYNGITTLKLNNVNTTYVAPNPPAPVSVVK